MDYKKFATAGSKKEMASKNIRNQRPAANWYMLQSCFGHNFMIGLIMKKQPEAKAREKLYAFVQLIGPRKQAEKFSLSAQTEGT